MVILDDVLFPIIPPEVDDTARINRCIDSISSGGASGDLVIPEGTYAISGDGVIIPVGVNLHMSAVAKFIYTGFGTCLTFEASKNGNHKIGQIERSNIGWTSSDTTSVGIKIKNSNHNNFSITSAKLFHEGIKLYAYGDGTGSNAGGGTCYNTLTLGQINDNKIGLSFKQDNAGWVNANTIIGGSIRISSNLDEYTGTMLIDMSTEGNGNTFLGVVLEGTGHEKTAVIKNGRNMFLNCRMEANRPESWHLLSTSQRNQIIGGTDNLSYGCDIFKDEGSENMIIGAHGLKLYGDNGIMGADAALVLNAYNSDGNVMIRTLGPTDKTFYEMTSTGEMRFYDTTIGKVDGTTVPVMKINPATYSISGGRFTCEIPKLTSNVAGPSIKKSNVYLTNNTQATLIQYFQEMIAGQGQIITIIANDNFTTISNNGNIKLKGGTSFAMKQYDSIQLVYTEYGDGNYDWIEISRTVI